jgi:hypothetical protein
MGAYRFHQTTPGGHLDITDAEVAMHIDLWDNGTPFEVVFAAADTFTTQRMYRFTNHTDFDITFSNHTGSIVATLTPGDILQADVTDITSGEAGDWHFRHYFGHIENIADATMKLLGAFSAVFDISGCTGVADGFMIENGTDYMRLTRAAANTLNFRSEFGQAIFDTSDTTTFHMAANDAGNKTFTISGTNAGAGDALALISFDLIDIEGKVGFGTATTPHAGVGYARWAFEGKDSGSDGPHFQITTEIDNYPLIHMRNWAHDDITLAFDAYYDGAWKSSDTDTNFAIRKYTDKFLIDFCAKVAPGGAVSWYHALSIDGYGNVGVNSTSWGTSAASVFSIGTGTAPSTSPADEIQIYSADLAGVAVSAAMHVRSESGAIAAFGKNWLLGGATTMDGTAVGVLQIHNGTAPNGAVNDTIQIYAKDSSDGTSTIAYMLEQSVEAIGTFTASNKVKVYFNGTEYWIQLDAVAP